MSRNLKALGLAMVAVFALSAMAASAAQAGTHHITVNTSPAIVTAKDTVNTKFEITGGSHSVTCDETLYEGTLSSTTSTDITVTPTYAKCKVDGFITTETGAGAEMKETGLIEINHCAYVLKGATDANGHGAAEVECAEGSDITINYTVFGSTCTVHVTPQTPTQGVHYEQNGEKIKIKATVTGIKYHETGGGFCPASVTKEDGTLNGTVEAEGFKDDKVSCSALTGTEKTTPGSHYTNCENGAQALTLNENVT